MLKFLRSKLFISIILLALAAVLTFVLLPKMYGSQQATEDVVQFIDDVNAGTQISEEMLSTKKIGRYGVDAAVITKKSDIVGKYAAKDIRHDSNLYSDMFADDWSEVDGAVDTLLKDGDKLITLSLDSAAQSVGGQAKPGDVVDILTQKAVKVSLDEYGQAVGNTDKIEMEMTTLLKNVIVYKLQNQAMEDVTSLNRKFYSIQQANDGSEKDFDSSLVPAFVTVIVNDEQAVKLANQEYSGTVHMLLHPKIEKAEEEKQQEEAATDAEKATDAAKTAEPNKTADQKTAEGAKK